VGRSLLAGQLEKRNEPKAAQAEYAAATQLAPDVVENFEGIAHTNLTMGHTKEAERQLEALLRRKDLTPVRQGAILNELGGVEEALDDEEAAEARYRESVATDPRHSYPPRYNLAVILMRRHDYAGAEEQLRAALELVPENADGNFALAQCLWEEGKRAQALPYLERAAGLNPNSAKMQQALVQARAMLGR
jgi:tetratricopeptide (TPR) repeat protein